MTLFIKIWNSRYCFRIACGDGSRYIRIPAGVAICCGLIHIVSLECYAEFNVRLAHHVSTTSLFKLRYYAVVMIPQHRRLPTLFRNISFLDIIGNGDCSSWSRVLHLVEWNSVSFVWDGRGKETTFIYYI